MKYLCKKALASLLMLVMIAGLFTSMPIKKAQAATVMKITVKHPDMNTVKLSWSKVSDAYGYNIYYKESVSDTYHLASSTLDNKIVFDKLKSDKFYYFKVTAYSIISGKQVEVAASTDLKVRSNKIGIDVSKWNGDIDWKKVKAAGIEYAIVRISYTTSTTAEKLYEQNIKGAQEAGIPVGVYVYSMATTEDQAKKEADYALKLLNGCKLQYPVAFDIEDPTQAKIAKDKAGREKLTKVTKAFCDRIVSKTKNTTKYKAMIYTGCNFSKTYLNMSELKGYDWWIAHYGDSTKYTSYSGKYHYGSKCNYEKTRFWQYSSSGTVNGIKGRVDMNYELDTKESVYGMVHFNASTGAETYVVQNGETLATIADKYNVGVQNIIEQDKNYTTASQLKKGNTIFLNSRGLAANGAKVSNVTGVKAVSNGFDSIKLTWKPLNYSNGYYIYRATSKNGAYTKVGTVTGTSFIDRKLTTKKEYYYKVIGYKQNNNAIIVSPGASIVAGKAHILPPTNIKVSETQYNSITLKWTKSADATEYRIAYATSKNGKYKKAGYSKTTTFTHKKLTLGKTYYYKIQAIKKYNNKNYWSEESKIASGTVKVGTTKINSMSTSSRSATVKYKKISGAHGYSIYQATSKNGKYTRVANTTRLQYTKYGLTSKKRYYYKVRAYRVVKNKKIYGNYSNIYSIKVK